MPRKEWYQEIKQIKAYRDRNQIKVGDKFLWDFRDYLGTIYGTSGTLKKQYMPVSIYKIGKSEMTVIAVQTGTNGYGEFVDYILTDNIMYDGRGWTIRVNGADAFKMERVNDSV